MNNNKLSSYDDPENNDKDTDTERKQRNEQECTPVLAGTGSAVVLVEKMRPLPGPACAKEKRGLRSRSGPTPSTSSCTRSAMEAITTGRRSQREAARNANRFAALANGEDNEEEGEPQPPIYIDSEESDGADNGERKKPPLKRRMAKKEVEGEPSSAEETIGKRGRKQTTGFYVGRGKAIERQNQLKREALALDMEASIRKLTAGQVLSSHKTTVSDKLEELENAPTEDVAQQARNSMVEVWKVAMSSKNLKGGYVKALKQAAAIGTASAEVLSLRADNRELNDDALRQVKALRRELESTKREAQKAKEEAERTKGEMEKLRMELEEARRRGRTRDRVRAAIEDSPPSSPLPLPSIDTRRETSVKSIASTMEMEVDDPTPNTEDTKDREPAPPEEDQNPPEYSDIRRKKEILPPREEWPEVIRPPIRGKAKIIEDGILTGTRVRVVEDTRRKPPITTHKEDGGPRNIDARSLMDELAPKMLEWLKSSLTALGLTGPTGNNGKGETRSSKNRKKGPREKEQTSPSAPASTPLKKGAGRGGLHPTTVPNQKLWCVVAGGKTTESTLPGPTEKKKTTPAHEEWVEVKSRRKAGKTSPAEIKTTADKKRHKEPNSGTGQAQTRGPTGKPAPDRKKEGKSQGTTGQKIPLRKPPRTAAVTLTCPPDEYAHAMRTAREKINLRDIGIEALRPKKAATGAIILEIPGPNGSEKAAVLRDRMEEALRHMEGVRVVRPVKMGELRVKSILDSTTTDEIREAISKLGGCKMEEVRTGDIRPAPNGLGTLWVQCPIVAANKAARAGRIALDWSTPTVHALEPRQLSCFKCLEPGHVQAVCPNPTDRSNLCYRCGREGHIARGCEYTPRCVVCEELGQPSAHKMGGKACKAPRKKGGPPRMTRPTTTNQMEVDTIETPPAVRGGPTPSGGAPVPVRRGNNSRKEQRPTVRGGTTPPDEVQTTVPARAVQDEEAMDVEVEPDPATVRPPQGGDLPEEVTDGGTSGEPARSPQ